MIERNLAGPLRASAEKMPIVAVLGPRQSGKTTLCRSTFPDKPYVSLELLDERDYARSDPRGFLDEYADGAIIDEAQHAPDLFSYLQVDVDERPDPGRFILTGSQHFGLTEAITQSLAGRVALLTLLPPSVDELARFPDPPQTLFVTLWKGSYPRIFDRGLDPGRWLADYVATYVQRDVRQIQNVTDVDAFTAFVRLVAGRTASELNLSRLGGDAGVSHNTARSWLSVLEASFLVYRLTPWQANLRKRVVKAPKVHLFDSGLACHLLGIREPEQLRHHPLRGAIFESWAASEIYKARVHAARPPDLFHFRDDRGTEVDVVVERGDEVVAVECKSGSTVVPDFLEGLETFATRVEDRLPHLRMVRRLIYGGEQRQRRRSIAVVPWREVAEVRW